MNKKNSAIHINRARASLSQVLSWYGQTKNHSPAIQAKLRSDLDLLKNCLHKLDQEIIYIAVFGLVSRGKSAVLNALMGEKVLQTGPLNGVTQWAKSIRWNISSLDPDQESKIIELIDTPGLDEINGEIRGQMAKDVANQADLILFVISGDITRTEYEAICELKKLQKPLILVFNKIDLYPDQDRQTIYKQLQDLGAKRRLISINDIVMVSAEPAPIQVRIESADNNISYEWEKPLPQIDELREKILTLLQKEGLSLLALNALVQAKDIEENMARKIIELRQKEAEKLIWRFVQYKSVAVAINPIGLIDVMGGIITDLMLIRALSKLYNLPMTGYEAGKLWQTILLSSGGLLMGELVSSIMLGVEKTTSVLNGENGGSFANYMTTGMMQGAIAGYGSYIVGKAAQIYLEKGCTWGELGANTVIQEIILEMNKN